MGEPLPEEDPRDLMDWLFYDMDLVLAEGYHWLPLDHIEIVGKDGITRPAHPEGITVGQLPHRFGAADVSDLCDRIVDRYFWEAVVSGA